MALRFPILFFLTLNLLLGYRCIATDGLIQFRGQQDSLINLWNQLTMKSIEFEASFQKDLKLKGEYGDLLKAYHLELGDPSKLNNSLRKQFIQNFPEIFEHKDIIIIEVVSSGEKITYTNLVVSFDNVDSINIDFFDHTIGGWEKFNSSTGRYFHIDTDLKKYRSTNGNNFDQITITHFNYQMPTTSEYFLPWTLVGSIFDSLNITYPKLQ
jgi:hypothetical protein